jgi:hypothetical protein
MTLPVLPPISFGPFVQPNGQLTPAALAFLTQIWTGVFGGAQPGVVLLGYLDAINFNIVGDNKINLTLPTGAIGWRAALGLIYGTSGSFSAAHAGLFSLPFTQGTTLVSPTALSGITASGPNTAGAVITFTPGLTAVWNYSTVYLNVGTPQNGSSQGNFYLYGNSVY